ncbi:MAG: GTP cyclohydrolase FolE2 [Fimbriimonadales bacterium]|nr:MAG: GTP cyclohydrolase FolE2 [Fimbriimonadales bacterium]
MLTPSTESLPDIQNTSDHRGITLEQVGITDLRYPITVLDRAQGQQRTIATLTMSVCLPHHFKGTHMSRFVEILNHYRGEFTMRTLPDLLHEMKQRLEAAAARIEIHFPYFLERTAPVSGMKALMDYQCTFIGESNGSTDDFVLGVRVPVASLCPCSKEISEYGAHNQRGEVDIMVRSVRDQHGHPEIIWIEELIQIAEEAASAPLYPLLKRPDERFVTMQAYDNPAFVEDITRDVAVQLRADERIAWFQVRVTNYESIHNHNAFASTSWSRQQVSS